MVTIEYRPAPAPSGSRAGFGLRANRHAGVRLEAVSLPTRHRAIVARSLAVFQVGESGTGQHLFDAAEACGAPDDYVHDLRAFIAEENEHARLLALVLERLDWPLRDGHWTDRAFVALRRLRSLRTEVLTLLVAELVAHRYYAALRDGVADPGLADVFGRIQADETRHLDFHAATLPPFLRRFPPPVRVVVRTLWNLLLTGTSVTIALDHGRALGLMGVTRREFVADIWRSRAALDARLFGPPTGSGADAGC